MNQNPDKTTAPSISLDLLRIKSAELGNGVIAISREIAGLEQRLEQLRADRLSTSGAKSFIDKFIDGVEKDEAAKAALTAGTTIVE